MGAVIFNIISAHHHQNCNWIDWLTFFFFHVSSHVYITRRLIRRLQSASFFFFRLLQHCAEFDDDKKIYIEAVQYAYIDDVIKIKYFFDSLSTALKCKERIQKLISLLIFSFFFSFLPNHHCYLNWIKFFVCASPRISKTSSLSTSSSMLVAVRVVNDELFFFTKEKKVRNRLRDKIQKYKSVDY